MDPIATTTRDAFHDVTESDQQTKADRLGEKTQEEPELVVLPTPTIPSTSATKKKKEKAKRQEEQEAYADKLAFALTKSILPSPPSRKKHAVATATAAMNADEIWKMMASAPPLRGSRADVKQQTKTNLNKIEKDEEENEDEDEEDGETATTASSSGCPPQLEYQRQQYEIENSQVLLPPRNFEPQQFNAYYSDCFFRFLRPIVDHINSQQRSLMHRSDCLEKLRKMAAAVVILQKLQLIARDAASILLGRPEERESQINHLRDMLEGVLRVVRNSNQHPKILYGIYSDDVDDDEDADTIENELAPNYVRNHLFLFFQILSMQHQKLAEVITKITQAFEKLDHAWQTNENVIV